MIHLCGDWLVYELYYAYFFFFWYFGISIFGFVGIIVMSQLMTKTQSIKSFNGWDGPVTSTHFSYVWRSICTFRKRLYRYIGWHYLADKMANQWAYLMLKEPISLWNDIYLMESQNKNQSLQSVYNPFIFFISEFVWLMIGKIQNIACLMNTLKLDWFKWSHNFHTIKWFKRCIRCICESKNNKSNTYIFQRRQTACSFQYDRYIW